MSTRIITGYTGKRTITASDDAEIYRAMGINTGLLPIENRMAASMPSINELVVNSGFLAIQGHIGRFLRESFPIGTCASGAHRIDVCICRYKKDLTTNIESMTVMVLKGAETTGTAVAPALSTGVIEDGATQVDLLLYTIKLDGSTVTLSSWDKIAKTGSIIQLEDMKVNSANCVIDTTYDGFPYRVDIICGCTEDYRPDVLLKDEDVSKFYGLAATGNGHVRLYCASNSFGEITIPVITLYYS